MDDLKSTYYNFGMLVKDMPTPESVEKQMQEYIYLCLRLADANRMDDEGKERYKSAIDKLHEQASEKYLSLVYGTVYAGFLALDYETARVLDHNLEASLQRMLKTAEQMDNQVLVGKATETLLWLSLEREEIRTHALVRNCGENMLFAEMWSADHIQKLIERVKEQKQKEKASKDAQ